MYPIQPIPPVLPISSTFNLDAAQGNLESLDPIVYAKEVGVISRESKKISITNLLLSHWVQVSKGHHGYGCWSKELSFLQQETVHRTSVRQHMTPEMLVYIEGLLGKSLKHKCDSFMGGDLFEGFEEVYVQDATHFSLPKHLVDVFPGSGGKGKGSATAKIQAVLNLKRGQFADFKLGSFRDNDQKDAGRFVEKLNKGDLIIRDLGYSKLDTFKQIAEKEAYFVSRYKPGAIIFDAKNGERIDLLKKLKRKKFVDFEVKIGVKAQMKCRLVAVPVPPEIAQKRREKAKAHRNKKTKHSKAYYDLLDFSIFITNVPEDFWTLKQIMEAYKCRWYIEIIFKGWKSHLKIGKAFPKSKVGEFNVRFLLYASLLMVTLIVMPFFQYLQKRAEQNGKQISILRLCEFISSFLMFMIMSKDWEIIVEMADYHYTYDVRVNRENMIQMIYS